LRIFGQASIKHVPTLTACAYMINLTNQHVASIIYSAVKR
jgi:hypothetical protein